MRIESLTKIYNIISLDFASCRFITRKTGLNFNTVYKIIHYLKCLNLTETKKFGNTTLYKIPEKYKLSYVIELYTSVGN